MKRRTLLQTLAVVPLLAGRQVQAQRTGPARVGWISADRAERSNFYAEFMAGMRDFGHVEGRDFIVDARWGNGDLDAVDPLVVALLQTRPDVVVTQGPVVRRIQAIGTSVPIVFGFSGDPVAAGLVDSLARPGRNMTGMSFLALDLVGKRIELLKEVIPGLRRVAILANPGHPGELSELRVSQEAAVKLGVAVDYFQVRNPEDLEPALVGTLKATSRAINVFPDAGMMRHAERIAAFGTQHRLPAISGWSVFAKRGNVLSYGPSQEQGFRRLAYFVDRILKGARPADLPVELPSRVELVINLPAAKAIGLAIPNSLLLRADEVIR
jgi:putative ABC transport system substrate-binding protein